MHGPRERPWFIERQKGVDVIEFDFKGMNWQEPVKVVIELLFACVVRYRAAAHLGDRPATHYVRCKQGLYGRVGGEASFNGTRMDGSNDRRSPLAALFLERRDLEDS